MTNTPVNPLRQLRMEARLGVEQLADRVGVSKQFIIRAEQAVYDSPPPRLLEYYSLAKWDEDELINEYTEFQHFTRKTNYGRLLDPRPVGNPEFAHPFTYWREASGLSRQSISTLYCVHPATVFKFEQQAHLVNSLPPQLSDALLESGYSPSTISSLGADFNQYKLLRRKEVVISGHADE